jgi:hypothetical protein
MFTTIEYESTRRARMKAAALRAHAAGQTFGQYLDATRGQFRHPEPRELDVVSKEALWQLALVSFGHSDIQLEGVQ